MMGSAGGLAPGSGLEFLGALPPGRHPWPWDEAAGGSWKKTEKGERMALFTGEVGTKSTSLPDWL